jgi:hypothetical protein
MLKIKIHGLVLNKNSSYLLDAELLQHGLLDGLKEDSHIHKEDIIALLEMKTLLEELLYVLNFF